MNDGSFVITEEILATLLARLQKTNTSGTSVSELGEAHKSSELSEALHAAYGMYLEENRLAEKLGEVIDTLEKHRAIGEKKAEDMRREDFGYKEKYQRARKALLALLDAEESGDY